MNKAQLIESLKTAGLDVDEGLRRLNGDSNLYLQVIRRFALDDAQGMMQLRGLLDSSRNEEACILVHTLRGTTAIIGAAVLSDSLRIVETDLVRILDSPGEALNMAFFKEAERLFLDLTKRLGMLDLSVPEGMQFSDIFSLSDDEWTEQLVILREYIDLQQPRDSLELLELLKSSGPDDKMKKALKELDSGIRGYRFDEALDRITRILEERRS